MGYVLFYPTANDLCLFLDPRDHARFVKSVPVLLNIVFKQ